MKPINIQNYKTTILVDVTAFYNEKGGMPIFLKIIKAFENLIKNSKVSKAIFCVDPTLTDSVSKNIENSKFVFLEGSIQDQVRRLAKKNSAFLLVCYGDTDKLVPLCKELKVKNAMFITENDISKYRDSNLLENYRFFPARIIEHLGHAFWWRITPKELIPENFLQHDILPDKSVSEFQFLNELALTLDEDATQILERNKVFRLLNDLHQEHIMSQILQIVSYLADWKEKNLTDIQKEEVFRVIVAIICDVHAQLTRSGDMIITPRMTELMIRFQKIHMIIQRDYFNNDQMGIINKLMEENRKLKGKVPRYFDHTQYNYDVPIITRK